MEVCRYLSDNAMAFIPPLVPRLNLSDYSEKIALNATQFWVLNDEDEVGFAACYLNNPESEIGFITSISVCQKFQGKGLGSLLLNSIVSVGREQGFKHIRLEVFHENRVAVEFYLKFGFEILDQTQNKMILNFKLA